MQFTVLSSEIQGVMCEVIQVHEVVFQDLRIY